MKKLLTGNEAIAYGAYRAGVKFGAAYPGTPSTEIMSNYAKYPGVYAEWTTNEKVSLDVAIGASYAGKRAFVTMKHVGLNVAADSLFYAVFTGVKGGLVVVTADDPGMHSSQNEQDNRNYGKFAKLPVLEPADSAEGAEFMGLAMELSETYDTPVILRSTTRISHSRSLIEVEEPQKLEELEEEIQYYQRNVTKQIVMPNNARKLHVIVEERLRRLAEYAETASFNRLEPGDDELGIVASGVAYQYAREVFPNATFLKLGMAYPLPRELFFQLANKVKKVVVIEELDPFYEEHLRVLGIPVIGKEVFPITGEFNPALIRQCAVKAGLLPSTAHVQIAATGEKALPAINLSPRPPMLCPGCGYRGIFHELTRMKALVFGDIGCYTLGCIPPLDATHTCGCMGAGIGVLHGVDKVEVKDPTVAVIGDSTLFHSGLAPLINIVYNGGVSTVIIFDNRITAMTGFQGNPSTGNTLQGKFTVAINIEDMVRSMGINKIDTVNPFDVKKVRGVLKDHLNTPEVSVIVSRYPCTLYNKEKYPAPIIEVEKCNYCKNCLKIGCAPLVDRENHVEIDAILCNGCGYCIKVCPTGAIVQDQEFERGECHV